MAGRCRDLTAHTPSDRQLLRRGRGISRGRSYDRIRIRSAGRGLSAAGESGDRCRDIRTSGPQRRDRSDRGGFDLGPVQCRLCDDLQLRPINAGRAGWSITTAGSAISIVLWLAVLSVPAGGFLADLTKRPQSILAAGCIVFAILMMAL